MWGELNLAELGSAEWKEKNLRKIALSFYQSVQDSNWLDGKKKKKVSFKNNRV